MRDDDADILPAASARSGLGPARPRRLHRDDRYDDEDDLEVVVVRRRRGRLLEQEERPRPTGLFPRRGDARMPMRHGAGRGAALVLLALLLVVVLWWWWWSGASHEYRTFPPSGSVTVSTRLRPGAATARLAIDAGERDAIVQFLTPKGERHVLSVFMRAGERRIVPVPPGDWRVRVIEGRTWAGPQRLFGSATHVRRYPRLLHLARTGHLSLSLAASEGTGA